MVAGGVAWTCCVVNEDTREESDGYSVAGGSAGASAAGGSAAGGAGAGAGGWPGHSVRARSDSVRQAA